MRQRQTSLILRVVYVYLLTFVASFIFYPIFSGFYKYMFNLPKFESMFSLWSNESDLMISGLLFAMFLFLPLFVFILMPRKQWLVWIIPIILPVIIFFTEPSYIFWFAVFTIVGGFLGWLIKFGPVSDLKGHVWGKDQK